MKKIIFLVITFHILLFTSRSCSAQNLFDLSHTKLFVDYLYQSGQYSLAAEECERWLSLQPESDSASLLLLKSYRKGGMYQRGISKAKIIFPDFEEMNPTIAKEFSILLLLNRNFSQADSFLVTETSFSNADRDYLLMNKNLMMKNWKGAEQIYLTNNYDNTRAFAPYSVVFKNYKELPHRSAALAMTMSTLIPGTGKFYTGDWKDAIFSMVLVGATGIQAYRGFNEKGVKSAYGWIFGGFGAGLYLGNIYGSFKSAKDFNHKHENELLKKATDLFSINL